jgi:hypothetical protein
VTGVDFLPRLFATLSQLHVHEGDKHGAGNQLRKGIEKQLATSNDSAASTFSYMEFYSLAEEEGKWLAMQIENRYL